MAFTPYTFTDAQLVDIRRYCGYPNYGDGNVVQPFPWIMRFYQVLEYKLTHCDQAEGQVVTTYLAQLNQLEAAIPGAGANLDTDQAAVWKHNANEVRDRSALFDQWRLRLCQFFGIPPGPNFGATGGSVALVV